MKNLTWLAVIFSFSLMAQNNVPTQTELAKKQIWKWLRSMPKNALTCTPHFFGMGNYQLFVQEAPHAFNLLKIHQHRLTPSLEHNFPFTNGSGFGEIVKTEFGLCMGHTSALRKFNMVSFFDKENKHGLFIPNKETNPNQWLEYYQKKVDLVMANKPTIFPGFNNLHELSSEPAIQDYIKRKIVDTWAEENISAGGAEILASVREKFTPAKARDLHASLTEKLSFNYNPRLYFAGEAPSMFSKKQWIHVMQVHKVEPKLADGSYTMYVWDINYPGASSSIAVKVEADGTIMYNGNKMAEVEYVPWDEYEVGEMLTNLITFCEKYPQVCKPQ